MSLIENDKDVSIPFNEEFQQAIIGHCLNDYRFFLQCHDKLKPQWFTRNIMLANIFEQMVMSYDAHQVAPRSIGEVMNEPFFLEQRSDEKEKYKNLMELCSWNATSHKAFNLNKVKQQLTGWIRLCMFKEAVESSGKKYKMGGFEEAYGWTKDRILKIESATFEDDAVAMKFENAAEWLKDDILETSNAISTGSKTLDFCLGGGLFKGETTAIMAPVNQGKSTFLMTTVRHAVKQGKKVLWITHEDSPRKLRKRLLSSFLGVSKQTLSNPALFQDSKARLDLLAVSSYLDQHLVYLPYSKVGGMFIEDVANEIYKRHTQMINKTGSGFDIIVDDYPKKLKMKNRNPEHYRSELAEVYDTFNHIAIELDVHCFVAIQTNREGMKQNMGKVKSNQLIGMDLVDESYGIAQNMGNIISLNRSPDDKIYNVARFSITKSRNDITDIAVCTRTAYAQTLTHGDRDMFDLNVKFILPDPQNNYQLQEFNHVISMLKPEIPKNFLACVGQNTNIVQPIEVINQALKKIESGEITEEQSYQSFVDSFTLPRYDKNKPDGENNGQTA